MVAEHEGDDEERDAEEHGNGGDDVDEVGDLAGDRSLHRLEAAGQDRDAAHHRPIARIHDHTSTRTYSETLPW